MRINPWIVAALAAGSAAHANAQSVASKAMLPMLDFGRIHTVLIERCQVASPETLPALKEALEGWQTHNEAPQRVLQAYMFASTAKLQDRPNAPTLSPAQLKEAVKMIQDASTTKFTRESAAWSQNKMHEYCLAYPAKLQSLEMDFAARYALDKTKIDAAIAQEQEKKPEAPVERKAQ